MQAVPIFEVNGSILLEVPKAIAEAMKLASGGTVEMQCIDGSLIIKPIHPSPLTLDETLAVADPTDDFSAEEREWISRNLLGGPLI